MPFFSVYFGFRLHSLFLFLCCIALASSLKSVRSIVIRDREEVIKKTLNHILTKQFSSQQLQKLIQGYDKLDNQGEYVRFCAVVLYHLKQQYSVKKKSGL